VEALLGKLFDWWPLTLAAPIYATWYKIFFSGPNWTARIRGWLENQSWNVAYTEMLGSLGRRLDALFGQRLFSAKAFSVCVGIAVGYALIWFMLSSLENRYDSAIDLVVLAASTCISFAVAFWFCRWFQRVQSTEQELRPGVMRWHSIRGHLVYFVVGSISFATAGAVGYAIAIADVEILAGAAIFAASGVMAGAFAAVVMSAGAVGAIGASAGTVAVAFTVAFALGGTAVVVKAGAAALLLFFVLPLVNALFDWPSWAASRWLVRRLGADACNPILWRRWMLLTGHILLDVALALLALFGLALILSVFFSGEEWNAARNTPFLVEGSTLSIMLLSTLVPTTLHLFCAVFALFPALPLGKDVVIRLIPYKHNFEEFEAGDKALVSLWLTFWTVLSICIVHTLMAYAVPWLLDRLTAPVIWSGFGDEHKRTFWQALFDAARAVQQWSGIETLF